MKLLFNGCSFVAGDFLTWHQHFPHINPDLHIWGRQPHPSIPQEEIKRLADLYRTKLRPQDNLAAQVSRLTGLEAIDISADGNSNMAIAQSTIAWLSENPGQYHVCIGWTEQTRRLVWDHTGQQWINLSVHRLQDQYLPRRLGDWIKLGIVSAPPEDHVLDYALSLTLLNTWLAHKGIASTQWRSMGSAIDPRCLATRTTYGVALAQPDLILDPKSWLGSQGSWWATSWFDQLAVEDCITPTNRHPNLAAVQAQAAKIAEHITPNR